MSRRIYLPALLVGLLLFAGATVAQTPQLQEPGCKPCEDPVAGSPETDDLTCGSQPPTCGGGVSGGGSTYLFSGEFHHSETDLTIEGRGLDFTWARKYRSRIGPDSPNGINWDHSYNIYIEAPNVGPSEVLDLMFDDPDTMHWQQPTNPGGAIPDLRYCTLRAPLSSDFVTGTVFAEVDSIDQMTIDGVVPAVGDFNAYLISAKNLNREGTLGINTAGMTRDGIQCGIPGFDLVLHDGNTRVDTYTPTGGGTWETREYFRTFVENNDGTYTLTFPDLGTWNFNAFDNSPEQGKIDTIVDRNGNSLAFVYDGLGRLDTITDTLGRNIFIAYNINGFIDSVTDFAGRQVVYDYYDGLTPEGSFGDLKSVTTPKVLGTPNGNDFPAGKTTTYTYSKGLPDPQLNHNLLTITDPKGQIFIENTYAPTVNPLDVEFDHVVSQRLGNPGERFEYFYLPVVPNPANNFAVLRTIENDRNGNVIESFFDVQSRMVMLHEYTGQAIPFAQTTDILNRPGPQIRPADPPIFETRWDYDNESQVVKVTYPNQNDVQYLYDAANPDR
ncbi:MAG: DUF6531 domain-containing protein, partial [Acidobacteriota bacterium]|nr:DUF6531 domain-containing protein [Acidobacteriota bacterium]